MSIVLRYSSAALGILQRPIVACQPRNDRTLIPTPHRDQHLSSPGQLRSQFRGRRPGEIDPDLVHRGHDFRMDARTWIRAGGDRSRFGWVGQQVEPRGGHLRPAGVVNAGEEHGIHDADSSEREATTHIGSHRSCFRMTIAEAGHAD